MPKLSKSNVANPDKKAVAPPQLPGKTVEASKSEMVEAVLVDYLDFRFPISVGEFIVLKSSVNRVFKSSMEVGVKVFAENILTGERRHTSSAYVTFVAIDLNRRPHAVPPLILETEDDHRRFREAGERRRVRLNMRHKRPLSDA
jgi:acyl-CoA hydrolase